MAVLKYPIILITLFLALGIAAGYYISPAPIVSYGLNVILFASLLFTFWKAKKDFLQKPYFTINVVLFSFALGMLIQALHYTPNQKLHYSHFIGNENPVIKGIISERLKPNDYQEKYYFEVVSVNQKPATGKILLTVPKNTELLHLGDAFIIADSPQLIPKSLNPYQFDYSGYMKKQDVFHQLNLKDNYVNVGAVKNFDYYIGSLREKFIGSFAVHNYSPQVQQTLNALLLGQRQDMDTATSDNYKNAGVLHVLAISGLHFSVLFYILTMLFRPLSRMNNGRLVHLIGILSILWGFAFITGLSASVVRSVVMFSFICVGQYFNRNANIYNSLAVSMLVLLIAKPAFLFDAGFQLSYLSVFAIVWFEPYYRKVKLSRYKAVNYFSDTLLISLAAQIGVLPLSLYYFNQFPLLFLIANLIVIPLSNIVLVLGLLVLLFNFIWVDAALVMGKVLELLVELMNGFIAWIASFEGFILKDIPFSLALTISLCIVIEFVALWIYKKSYTRTIAVLAAILLFQIIFAFTSWSSKNNEELIVFHNRKNSMIALKNNNEIIIMSDDSLAENNRTIKAYNKGNFNQALKLQPIQNVLYFNDKKILIIDRELPYTPKMNPDVLILTNSSKVNLERLISQLKPKEIIADGTNYKTRVDQWKQTCQKEKIPFHATAEKGSYTFK